MVPDAVGITAEDAVAAGEPVGKTAADPGAGETAEDTVVAAGETFAAAGEAKTGRMGTGVFIATVLGAPIAFEAIPSM